MPANSKSIAIVLVLCGIEWHEHYEIMIQVSWCDSSSKMIYWYFHVCFMISLRAQIQSSYCKLSYYIYFLLKIMYHIQSLFLWTINNLHMDRICTFLIRVVMPTNNKYVPIGVVWQWLSWTLQLNDSCFMLFAHLTIDHNGGCVLHVYVDQGAVSIRKTVLPGVAIPMLKIRRPNGRLIFNMEIAIRR